jgi:flagellar biosynthesis/type III secretory pathway M-ring protein FliF/YscJ
MTGYLVLGGFVFIVIFGFTLFMIGLRHGRKLAEADYAEERERKEKNERDYQKAKQEIHQEVFHDTEERKAELSGHSDAVDRFNAINSGLSNRPRN